tara:strand:+ start:474 stop:704 length:231 start_codon:yes stop_codon:yes gene_type:complete
MTKNELKKLWWGLPHQTNKKELKLIVVSNKHKMVKVITDVEGYYQSSSHFPKNDLTEFALNLKNHTRFSDYNIVCI